jgi:hypothetical protein
MVCAEAMDAERLTAAMVRRGRNFRKEAFMFDGDLIVINADDWRLQVFFKFLAARAN